MIKLEALSKKYHGPVKRQSGEPFYMHPVVVAKIVSAYTSDVDTILGALLHDVVERKKLYPATDRFDSQ